MVQGDAAINVVLHPLWGYKLQIADWHNLPYGWQTSFEPIWSWKYVKPFPYIGFLILPQIRLRTVSSQSRCISLPFPWFLLWMRTFLCFIWIARFIWRFIVVARSNYLWTPCVNRVLVNWFVYSIWWNNC